MSPSDVQSRISVCLTRAVHDFCDQEKPQVVRDVLRAYLYDLCKNRFLFVLATLRYLQGLEMELPEEGRYSLGEMIVHPPARWEFEHVDIFGTVSDACCCAGRYRSSSRFLGVYPVESSDPLICPLEAMRIPMRHKPTSPWLQAFVRRRQLKAQLGTRCRSLVGYARKLTKTEFLERFAARPGAEIPMRDRKGRPYTIRRLIPDIEPSRLLDLTGYTPGEFWREVRKPNTVIPHKPQLELF